MKKLLLSLSTLLFAHSVATADELVEFSTSMDFDEFEVVLRHLSEIDAPLAAQLIAVIERFRRSSAPGDVTRYELDGITGHIVLEREDPQALGFAMFTVAEIQTKIEDAYLRATEELGI